MTNNEMTITIELNGVPVIKQEIIDMVHEHERPQPEPQLSEERRSSSNNKNHCLLLYTDDHPLHGRIIRRIHTRKR